MFENSLEPPNRALSNVFWQQSKRNVLEKRSECAAKLFCATLVSVAEVQAGSLVKRRQPIDINHVRHAFFRIQSLSSVGNNVKGTSGRGFGI